MTPPRASRRSSSSRATTIDAAALVRAFAAGAEALRAQADALNAINVFPVPDGDTGTNMSLTMRAAAEAASEASGAPADVAKAAAQGAFMGAKGNSGVILSQVLAGFAGLDSAAAEVDAAMLAECLERGRVAAYAVISEPREGTILTAITSAAEASRRAAGKGATADFALEAAATAANDAAARTPELLPVLREAGVVDAGAQGLAVLLDGMVRGVRGESIEAVEGFGAVDPAWLAATRRTHERDREHAGSCTEFVVRGEHLDVGVVRRRMNEMGDSAVVVGGEGLLRVHLHTAEPKVALAFGRTLGTVSGEKVDDMAAQIAAFAGGGDAAGATAGSAMAIIAVVTGEGLERLFRSLGAVVVRGGQTMNPSAGAIRAAIEAAGGPVVVLPNNANVVLTAEQAARGLKQRVRVAPSRSVPQGVAALVAMNPDAPFDDNVAAMLAAIAGVRSAEVTLAARSTRVRGLKVREGQPIGLIDGDLCFAQGTVAAAARACVERMVAGQEGVLVTLYYGQGETRGGAEALAVELRRDLGVEVEVVEGGQPHYPYLIGVE
ncbi:MAG: DAK2 domain-containing protein [Dehalococcoidia bacterium]